MAAAFNILRFLLVLLPAFCGVTFSYTQASRFTSYPDSQQFNEQHQVCKITATPGCTKVSVEKNKIKIRKKYREEHCEYDLFLIPNISSKLFAPDRCIPLPVTYSPSTFHTAYSLRGPPVVFA